VSVAHVKHLIMATCLKLTLKASICTLHFSKQTVVSKVATVEMLSNMSLMKISLHFSSAVKDVERTILFICMKLNWLSWFGVVETDVP
jgi:hypothetical protein